MFQFTEFPPHRLCVHRWVTYLSVCGVPPFGHLRIEACLRLPVAFRSLPRPSSALGAKASSMRILLLDLLTFFFAGVRSQESEFNMFPGSFSLFPAFRDITPGSMNPKRRPGFTSDLRYAVFKVLAEISSLHPLLESGCPSQGIRNTKHSLPPLFLLKAKIQGGMSPAGDRGDLKVLSSSFQGLSLPV
jgi:hypothetical protein